MSSEKFTIFCYPSGELISARLRRRRADLPKFETVLACTIIAGHHFNLKNALNPIRLQDKLATRIAIFENPVDPDRTILTRDIKNRCAHRLGNARKPSGRLKIDHVVGSFVHHF
jgi:hypothetical protein